MKQKLLCSLGSVFVPVVLIMSTPALAGKFTADASFTSDDSCHSAEAIIFVQRGAVDWATSSQGPARTGILDLTLSEIDMCNDQVLVSAQVKADLSARDLKFNAALNSVTLNTTVSLVNEINDQPLNITVEVAWEGQGEVVSGLTNSDWQSPGKKVRRGNPFAKRSRSARASGSISDGTTEFASLPDDDASITVARERPKQ